MCLPDFTHLTAVGMESVEKEKEGWLLWAGFLVEDETAGATARHTLNVYGLIRMYKKKRSRIPRKTKSYTDIETCIEKGAGALEHFSGITAGIASMLFPSIDTRLTPAAG